MARVRLLCSRNSQKVLTIDSSASLWAIQSSTELSWFWNSNTKMLIEMPLKYYLQIMTCMINRYFKYPNRFGHIVAAFVSGLPFCLHPELPLLTHAMCCAFELAWSQLLTSHTDKSNILRILRIIDGIPIAKLVFVLGGGYMYHIRLFYPWLAPKFLHRLVKLVTNDL